MAKPTLKYVKFVKAKGHLYGYFDTGKKENERRVYAPLGRFPSPAFMDKYVTMMGHRSRINSPLAVTVAQMADRFEASPRLASKSKGTQKYYVAMLKHIRKHLGEFPIGQVKRVHIVEVIENRLGGKVGVINGFIAVYGVLHSFAQVMDVLEHDSPTKHVPKLDTGAHEPWPEAALYAGLEAEHERTRLAISLLYYTGARIGDMVAFRWSDIRGGTLFYTQQKTGKAMEVPLHRDLAALLDATPKRGINIVTSYEGRPMTPQVIRRELKGFAKAQGIERVPHGLRKNAVIALLEAGGTVPEVAAITGQTFRIVERYAERVNKRRLGKSVILKMENNRK